jgi:spore maturation protein CgeB
MRIVLFCHSIVSDWNHGNAHFLRGIVRELQRRGHRLEVLEPLNGWSLSNLRADLGEEAEAPFRAAYPDLSSRPYDPETLDLEAALDGAELVLVHEWTPHVMVRRLADHRRTHNRFRLLFHDTHHRSVTAPTTLPREELSEFDGVLAFGEAIREVYLRDGWAARVWTWHEAADTTVFRPHQAERTGDLIWIGNWGDEERTAELAEFLFQPAAALHLNVTVHGVRYPQEALDRLAAARFRYSGYIANPAVPQAFARHRATVHVPRRPYAAALPGIPTIRVFEALACGIPLISAPWRDSEGLFAPGRDFLVAENGHAMQRQLARVLNEPELAAAIADQGRKTVLARHTCAHRADELLGICRELGLAPKEQVACVEA